MAGIPVAIGAALIGGAASIATAVLAKPKTPQVNAAPTRVDRSGSVVADALQQRQGSRANRRTGGLGVEASASSGTKSKLGN